MTFTFPFEALSIRWIITGEGKRLPFMYRFTVACLTPINSANVASDIDVFSRYFSSFMPFYTKQVSTCKALFIPKWFLT